MRRLAVVIGLVLAACGGHSAATDAAPEGGAADSPVDVLFDTSIDAPIDVAVDAMFDAAVDAPIDAPVDGVVDAPIDSSVDAMIDASIDAMIDASIDAPIDAAVDASIDAPVDAPIDAPVDAAIDAPTDAAVDAPVDGAIDAAIDAPVDAAIDAPGSCPAATWCQETAPIVGTIVLRSVFARTADDVFAVGNAGTILRRQSGVWTAMTSNTAANLHGVWAASANDAWAVGTGGVILHWDGATWAPPNPLPSPAPTADQEAVWGSSSSDVWIIGGPTVRHWTGAGWGVATGLTSTVLLSVHGTGPSDVWISGEGAETYHYSGALPWVRIDPLGLASTGIKDYFAIFALSATNVWTTASVPTKQSVNWNGTVWTPYAVTGAVFKALWGNATDNLYGVDLTNVGHWNGGAWSLVAPSFVTTTLYGVTGYGTEQWIVGANATIGYRHD